MLKKECPICENLFSGRADKKFCSNDCKSTFHNKLNSVANNRMRTTDSLLKKNRRVLKSFIERGVHKVHKSQLWEQGFKFPYLTQVIPQSDGMTYYFCYEFGYTEYAKEYYKLVVKELY